MDKPTLLHLMSQAGWIARFYDTSEMYAIFPQYLPNPAEMMLLTLNVCCRTPPDRQPH